MVRPLMIAAGIAVLAAAAAGTAGATRLRAESVASKDSFVGSLLRRAESWVLKRMPCSCPNGDPSEGCFFKRQVQCRVCAVGFHMNGHVCMPNICSCENGVPVSSGSCPADGVSACAKCDDGYVGAPGECDLPEGDAKVQLDASSSGSKAGNQVSGTGPVTGMPNLAVQKVAATGVSTSNPTASETLTAGTDLAKKTSSMMKTADPEPETTTALTLDGTGAGSGESPLVEQSPAVVAMESTLKSGSAMHNMMPTGPGAAMVHSALQGATATDPGEALKVTIDDAKLSKNNRVVDQAMTGSEGDLQKAPEVEMLDKGAMTGPKDDLQNTLKEDEPAKRAMTGSEGDLQKTLKEEMLDKGAMTGPEDDLQKTQKEDEPTKGAMTGPDDDLQNTLEDEEKPGEGAMTGSEDDLQKTLKEEMLDKGAMTGPEDDLQNTLKEDEPAKGAMTGPEDNLQNTLEDEEKPGEGAMTGPDDDLQKMLKEDKAGKEAMTGLEDDLQNTLEDEEKPGKGGLLVGSYGETGAGDVNSMLTLPK